MSWAKGLRGAKKVSAIFSSVSNSSPPCVVSGGWQVRGGPLLPTVEFHSQQIRESNWGWSMQTIGQLCG